MYQKNRSPTSRLKGVTPHEAWTGEMPYLGHMRIIGCVAWVHVPKEKRKKLDERSKKCYLIGYEGTNIFRLWNPVTKQVEGASHVDFDESRMMTSAVSDTDYWLADATGDATDDVFDAGGEATEHQHTPGDVTPGHIDLPNINDIQNILNQRRGASFTDSIMNPVCKSTSISPPPDPSQSPSIKSLNIYTS